MAMRLVSNNNCHVFRWRNSVGYRNLEVSLNDAVTFGQRMALHETDSCISHANSVGTGADGVSVCIHEIAETEHFDKTP
jgi:hypothetical protein